jgi:glyoxylase-like metal-dependent hydrolase (beta-lactamase superfamily II)
MPSPRRRRVLLYTWLALFVFLIVAISFVRHGRHQFDAPDAVRASVWRVHGQVSDFFAARAGSHVILFDAGADPEGHGLDALLAQLHAGRDDVSDVFVTHGHGDHIAAVPLLAHARVHAGSADVAMMAQKAPMVPRLGRYMRYVLPTPVVTAGDALTGPSELAVGGTEPVKAVPFAGHTPGSFVYLYDGVLFMGDSLNFDKDKLTLAFAPFTVDSALNKKNVAALPTLVPLDQIHIVCTGHGGCTPEAETRRMLDDIIKKAGS